MTVNQNDIYEITGFEAPITVVDAKTGGQRRYEAGDKFKASDWPVFHQTIPRAVENGLIKKVEADKKAAKASGGDK